MSDIAFFTLAETARRLGVNLRTLYRWEREGVAPAITQVGPRRRGVLVTDLMAFAASRKRTGASPKAAPEPQFWVGL